jgi:hypothetical protein
MNESQIPKKTPAATYKLSLLSRKSAFTCAFSFVNMCFYLEGLPFGAVFKELPDIHRTCVWEMEGRRRRQSPALILPTFKYTKHRKELPFVVPLLLLLLLLCTVGTLQWYQFDSFIRHQYQNFKHLSTSSFKNKDGRTRKRNRNSNTSNTLKNSFVYV